MAHFYGKLNGRAKTLATRCGTKNSGITALLNGWDVGVYVELKENTMVYKIYFATNGKIISHELTGMLKAHNVPGATLHKTVGYWQGGKELSYVLEIVGSEEKDRVLGLARDLKDLFHQSEVMVVQQRTEDVRYV